MESVAHRATRRNPQAVTEGADSFRRLLCSPLTPPLRSQPLLKCLKQFVQEGSQAAHANLELLMPRVGVFPDRLTLVACYFNVPTSSSNCSNCSCIPPLVLPDAIAASNASFEG